MTYFKSLLPIILTLFLLLVCGYIGRKLRIIDETASKKLSRLIISIGQPMLIIGALNNAEYSKENLKIALWATLIGFVMHTVLAISAFLICRKMKDLNRAKIFEFALLFSNCGFLGFPILDSIYQSSIGSFMGAFYVISFHLFMWTWGMVILGRQRTDIRLTPKKILLNYGTVPCAIGLTLYLLKPVFALLPLPVHTYALEPIGTFFTYLGSLCTPISVLITGALLATVSFRAMLRDRSLYLQSFLKLLLFPVIACLIAKLCGLSAQYILLCTVMAGLPSAASVCIMGELYDIDPAYASQTVGITSLLVTFTLPCIMLFAQWVISI